MNYEKLIVSEQHMGRINGIDCTVFALQGIASAKQVTFTDEYEFGEQVGVGAYSICKKCVHKKTRVEYAVKIMPKSKHDPAEEVDILLRYSHHPNVVSMRDVRVAGRAYVRNFAGI